MPGCEVSMLHGHDSETGIQCEQMWKAGERLGRVISWEKKWELRRVQGTKECNRIDFVLLSVSGLWFQEGTERVS
jgi:hypothetical protein